MSDDESLEQEKEQADLSVELSNCVQFRNVLLAFISFSQQRLEEAWERGVDLLDGLTRRLGSDIDWSRNDCGILLIIDH